MATIQTGTPGDIPTTELQGVLDRLETGEIIACVVCAVLATGAAETHLVMSTAARPLELLGAMAVASTDIAQGLLLAPPGGPAA